MATEKFNTQSTDNPFMGETNGQTLVRAFTTVGLLREFVELKNEITYDEKEAMALILLGVQNALIDQNNFNSAPNSAAENGQEAAA